MNDIKVQVSVPHVPKAVDLNILNLRTYGCFACANEVRYFGYLNRHVMRKNRPVPSFRKNQCLTAFPKLQTLGFGLSNQAIGNQTGFEMR